MFHRCVINAEKGRKPSAIFQVNTRKLAENQCKNWRHDEFAQVVHWNLCKKFNLQSSEPSMTILQRQ